MEGEEETWNMLEGGLMTVTDTLGSYRPTWPTSKPEVQNQPKLKGVNCTKVVVLGYVLHVLHVTPRCWLLN